MKLIWIAILFLFSGLSIAKAQTVNTPITPCDVYTEPAPLTAKDYIMGYSNGTMHYVDIQEYIKKIMELLPVSTVEQETWDPTTGLKKTVKQVIVQKDIAYMAACNAIASSPDLHFTLIQVWKDSPNFGGKGIQLCADTAIRTGQLAELLMPYLVGGSK